MYVIFSYYMWNFVKFHQQNEWRESMKKNYLIKKSRRVYYFFAILVCFCFMYGSNTETIYGAEPTQAMVFSPTDSPKTSEDITSIPAEDITQIPEHELTPTPKPKPMFKLEFSNPNNEWTYNGKTSIPSIERKKGAYWGELPVPQRTGYLFRYWYNSKTNASYAPEKNRKASEDVTLLARWELEQYEITYNLKGGDFEFDWPTETYTITSPEITLPEPVRKKHIFAGWYTTANYSGKKITSISTGSHGNVTFYAKWEKVAPSAVNISSLKNKSNKLTVKLKKVNKAKGYEIKVATDKKFKKNVSTYELGKKTSYSFVNPVKKTYYIKARAYAYDSFGTKVYGAYGKTAKIKVTKTGKQYNATSSSAKFTSAKALSSEQIRLKATIKKNIKSSDDFYYLVKLNPSNNKVEKSVKKVLKQKYLDVTLPIDGKNIGNLMSKYAVAVKNKGKYILISSPTYITNPEKSATNTMKYVLPASKKGIQGATVENSNLGTKNTLLNMDLKSLIKTDGTGTPYVYNGKTYYFSDQYVGQVRYYNTQEINVSMVILLSWDTNLTYLIHPSARVQGKNYYTLNTEDKKARETLEATFAYLGETFGKEDCYVSNWILGNEANAHTVWNYAGNLSLDAYTKSYARAFNMLYYGVKHGFKNSRVFISLDNEWNKASNGFSGKSFLTSFANAIKKENPKVQWNIAYHAYPAPLTAPAIWRNAGVNNTENTPYITPHNIEVLTKYVKKHYGSKTRIILSEQGFTSTAGESIQAAALAYSYYKCEFNSMIDAFIIRSEYDAAVEVQQGLSMGLIQPSPWHYKEAYIVYKYMDTPKSESFTNKYLSVIGAKKWKDIVPGYKASKFKSMPNSK